MFKCEICGTVYLPNYSVVLSELGTGRKYIRCPKDGGYAFDDSWTPGHNVELEAEIARLKKALAQEEEEKRALAEALENLKEELGEDHEKVAELKKELERKEFEIGLLEEELEIRYSHEADTNNPHGVTKEQVGLGNVANYPIATKEIAEARQSNEHYITPALLPEMPDLESHLKADNPHNITKDSIGLGNVENVKQVSESRFEAHLREGHEVTKEDVGLSEVDNVKQMPIEGGVFLGRVIAKSAEGGIRNIHSGVGAPPSGLGENGDIYIGIKEELE